MGEGGSGVFTAVLYDPERWWFGLFIAGYCEGTASFGCVKYEPPPPSCEEGIINP